MPTALFGYGDADAAHRAYTMLGATQSRLETLRLILAYPEVSTSDIARALDLTRNGVQPHLDALTRAGVVRERHTTHPRGSGPITYWSGDADEVHIVFESLLSHLFVGDGFA